MSIRNCLFFFIHFTILCGLCSCGQNNIDSFQKKGARIQMDLVHLFQEVGSREELMDIQGSVKNLFEQLVDVMIEADKWKEIHPEAKETQISGEASYALRREMQRLYKIDGCRKIIEEAQANALYRLSAYDPDY